MREKILKKLAFWHVTYPGRMLLLVTALTIVFGALAGQLSVTMRTSDLLPEGDPHVVQFNKIIDEFFTATNLVVVVQGEENRIKEYAEVLAPRILQLRDTSQNEIAQKEILSIKEKIKVLSQKANKESEVKELKNKISELEKRINLKLFQRIDYKSEIDFLRDHALMMIKEEDLINMKDVFMDPNLPGLLTNINNSLEKEYVGQEESISTREKEDGAVNFLNGIQGLMLHLQQDIEGNSIPMEAVQRTADNFLFGDPYMISYDKKALILIAIPNFTILDRDLLMTATISVQALVDDLASEFPDVKTGLSGDVAKEHDEQIYSEQALSYSTLIALVVIFVILVVSFRMWLAPLFAVLTLIIGVIWALGVSVLVVGQLNMITSMMSVVLLGLGIDFAIHMISGFTEWRAAGDSIGMAMEKIFLKSGKGIITGALTTACAFLTLMISQSRGMKEMGIVTGTGLLSILLATIIFLPVLLVFRERIWEKKQSKKAIKTRDISFRFLGNMGNWLSRRYVFTILASIILTVIMVLFAKRISFDYNLKNMEPDGIASVALMDTVLEKFDLSIQYAFIVADNVEESRDLAEKSREIGSVAITSDISLYLPSAEEQTKRIPHIINIKNQIESKPLISTMQKSHLANVIEELDRLEMNIMELQDMSFLGGQDKVDNKCKLLVGDPDKTNSINILQAFKNSLRDDNPRILKSLSKFQNEFAPYFKRSILKMCSTDPITLQDLPSTILDRYSNKRRDQFLITVYPADDMWQQEYLYRFVDNIERVSDKATGTAPVAIALIKVFARDGRNAILLTLLIVFILLWLDFGRPRFALMAMLPLACGVFWMVGFMKLAGMDLTMMSFIGLPMIIGIGIDDGVHIIHRWRHEGIGKIRTVFASTGKAIFLTSLTTGFAFGSLAFSAFRGWAQFGIFLFVGIIACFLTTVFILPGIIGFIESRQENSSGK